MSKYIFSDEERQIIRSMGKAKAHLETHCTAYDLMELLGKLPLDTTIYKMGFCDDDGVIQNRDTGRMFISFRSNKWEPTDDGSNQVDLMPIRRPTLFKKETKNV